MTERLSTTSTAHADFWVKGYWRRPVRGYCSKSGERRQTDDGGSGGGGIGRVVT